MAAMKAAILLFAAFPLCAVFLLGVACAPEGASAVPRTGTGTTRTPLPITAAAIVPQGTELRLDIVELSCHSCAGQVAAGTSHVPGVLRVSAEMLDHILVVRYDPTILTETALIDAIDKVVDAVVN
jgi:copper chaperone CopZ